MRNLVLASLFGTTLGVGVVSAVGKGGPVWFAYTEPHSFYLETAASGGGGNLNQQSTTVVGTTVCDFVLTDIVVGGRRGSFDPSNLSCVVVLVNGTPIACAGTTFADGSNGISPHVAPITTFSQGIRIPANSAISIEVAGLTEVGGRSITLAGYYI